MVFAKSAAALESSVSIVGYLALFVAIGLVFVFVNLLVGKFLRPHNPHQEKGEIYECGEPTIGSSYVQFDLRFYIVALLFIIFDVEVAFFFPWATVFGKSEQLASLAQENQAAVTSSQLSDDAERLLMEMGVANPTVPTVASQSSSVLETAAANETMVASAKTLSFITLIDIAVFFVVLMLGFFYVWKRGDLDWVKAVVNERRRNRTPSAEA
ncbi:MAG: NADH-quinone oxidoreductase subunit A [Planctomycetaceae bacterium]|nr:NADH-quinone oxidoreductase subunit A [Planctomycetaceae bacterium]|tara:strand:+ start:11233 stop:11868 length:636 start_codon:yes stop_codon:yes gene_type:complete